MSRMTEYIAIEDDNVVPLLSIGTFRMADQWMLSLYVTHGRVPCYQTLTGDDRMSFGGGGRNKSYASFEHIITRRNEVVHLRALDALGFFNAL